jgi:hypothetical protein
MHSTSMFQGRMSNEGMSDAQLTLPSRNFPLTSEIQQKRGGYGLQKQRFSEYPVSVSTRMVRSKSIDY